MTLAYAKDCACRLASQGHIRPGKRVWLAADARHRADFIFKEIIRGKRKVNRAASVYLSGRPGTVPFYPNGRPRTHTALAAPPPQRKKKSGPAPGA